MGKVLNTPILESLEELKRNKTKVVDYKSSKQLDCLLLFKKNKYLRLEELAIELEISVTTLRRWLNKYRSEGIVDFLKKDTRNRPYSIITEEIHEGLKKRLQDPENSFNGFWDAQNWIEEVYGVKVNYKSLWSHITHKLNGSLKIPRKSHVKKNKEAEAEFLKTS